MSNRETGGARPPEEPATETGEQEADDETIPLSEVTSMDEDYITGYMKEGMSREDAEKKHQEWLDSAEERQAAFAENLAKKEAENEKRRQEEKAAIEQARKEAMEEAQAEIDKLEADNDFEDFEWGDEDEDDFEDTARDDNREYVEKTDRLAKASALLGLYGTYKVGRWGAKKAYGGVKRGWDILGRNRLWYAQERARRAAKSGLFEMASGVSGMFSELANGVMDVLDPKKKLTKHRFGTWADRWKKAGEKTKSGKLDEPPWIKKEKEEEKKKKKEEEKKAKEKKAALEGKPIKKGKAA